jgi:cleavage stimulation factor subunit 3
VISARSTDSASDLQSPFLRRWAYCNAVAESPLRCAVITVTNLLPTIYEAIASAIGIMASEEAPWGGEEYEVTDGGDIQHSDEQVDQVAQDSHGSGDAADNGSDDGGDYDPESVTFNTTTENLEPAASSTPTQRSAAKPKMSGGFIVEASDDEEETPNTGAVPSVHLQTQMSSGNDFRNGNSATPSNTNAAPPHLSAAVAGLDPVALFEARIKEDPRGDMDAWLGLMAEQRRRSRLDDLRGVYNRFLEVFPQAVCHFMS